MASDIMQALANAGGMPTGRVAVCRWCERPITEVQDTQSFVIDWGDNGDYGCDGHPFSNEHGVWGHYPDDPALMLAGDQLALEVM